MVKKWLPLLLCCVLLLGGCSGKTDRSAAGDGALPAGYIPEGVKSVLTQLADANDFFVRDVFEHGYLQTDPNDTVTQDDGMTYVRVIAGRVTSYGALEALLRATYTAATAENLLAQGKYAEIDGKLYCCTELAPKAAAADADASFTIENGVLGENDVRFDVVYSDGTRVAMQAVNSDGAWRLADYYTF